MKVRGTLFKGSDRQCMAVEQRMKYSVEIFQLRHLKRFNDL